MNLTKNNEPQRNPAEALAKEDKFILYSLILGFLGFIVSAYLTILHYKNIIPPCTVSGGCETVLTSKYSMVGPIPVALLGILFFLAIIAVCVLILTSYKKIFLQSFYLMSAAGLLVALLLIFTQGFILHAFCQYCLICEASATGIAILAFLKYKSDKKEA